MTHKRSKTVIASAVSLALASMMLAPSVNAGVIRNTNPTTGAFLGSCGPDQAATQACVGALDLGNIETTIYKADGTVLGVLNKDTSNPLTYGDYPVMGLADYFISLVKSGVATTASLSGKVWPVGEPMAVKAVVGDMKTSEGKPNNCIINTAFLSLEDSTTKPQVSGYLNTTSLTGPEPVICSSAFQSHKRFKIPMQSASLDSATPIDLVFNVVDESVWATEFPANATNNPARTASDGLPGDAASNQLKLRPYQFFSKINNYTGKRLAGFKIVIGTGKGAAFVPASDTPGLVEKLHLSLGLGEAVDKSTGLPDPTKNIFAPDGMATFSAGLFGPIELPHFTTVGFFDERPAGYYVNQTCNTNPCPTYLNPAITAAMASLTPNLLTASDTIYSDITVKPSASLSSGALATNTLPSNYVGPVIPAGTAGLPFGDWLPFGWEPKGIFWDFDNDSTTDADLVAWWNGSTWLKNYASGFAPATEAELVAWGTNPQYAVDIVEDTLNLGINFIMKIGDGIPGGQFTVRVIPIVAADQTPPAYITNPPPALPTTPTDPTTPTPTLPPVVSSSSGGGGCAIGNDGRFDPTLPAMLFAGLGFLGWRRYKAGK